MTVDKFVKEGKIFPFKATSDEINKSLEVAKRDLSLAEDILGNNLDWCFAIAYNAVFQACRVYIFSLGFRPALLMCIRQSSDSWKQLRKHLTKTCSLILIELDGNDTGHYTTRQEW